MKQNILIVDDTALNLKLLLTIANKLENSEAHGFTDPMAALDWLADNPVGLVVVDYMMPQLDGLEFIARVRGMPATRSTPIVMITANEDKGICYQALETGASDFLPKPVDPLEFLARAKHMLALNAAQLALADRAAWLAAEVERATAEIRSRERETLIYLAKAAEYRDGTTGSHIQRMAHYAQLIAKGLGLDTAHQELLVDASAMHDIGKVAIPDRILLKGGKLDPDEFEIMKQHATYGYELLRDSQSRVLQAGAEIALSHHEKFDGSGYPQGLAGEAIPLNGRIVAVADVFDALTSERPYKKAWTVEAAADHLRAGAGTHFDPRCVDALLSQWPQVLQVKEQFSDHG
jgi:putative two-component system response regulator